MEQQRPNVIVFFTDQQRWDTTGVHGCPLDLTPNFDRMAAEGTHVFHATTCQPVCGPARSCLQTGLYATTTGCWRNGIPLPEDAKTLAHCFGEAGYRTAYIGKWHLARTRTAVPKALRGGYDYWLASDALEFTSDAYETVLYDNDDEPVRLPGYRVDALTDAAIRWIWEGATKRRSDEATQGEGGKPFYLFLSFIEPHHQNHRDDYPAPVGYEQRYRGRWMPPDLLALGGSAHQHWAGYCGMIKRLDEALGRLRDALKSLGMEQNTIILFTSDHGCHFKTRNREYKRSGHESSVRIPTALCGPGFDGGGQVREMVSLLDLPPTLLDAAGLDVPEVMQGRSILPLLNSATKREAAWPREAFVQISESQIGRAVRTQRWKYGVFSPDKMGNEQGMAERYREEYLYDLMSDPYELNNLIEFESHAAVCERMKRRLIERMLAAGEAEPEIESVPKRPSGQRRVSEQEVEG